MEELVAKRYGEAFFELSKENNSIDELYNDFQGFIESINLEQRFKALLSSPKLNAEEKKDMIKTIYEGKISDTLLGFMYLLIDKQRINSVENIFNEYKKLVEIERNLVKAQVFTVVKMKENELNKLKNMLEQKFDKKVQLKNIIDESIIGGVMLRIGDKVIDGSLKNRIESLREDLLNLKVI